MKNHEHKYASLRDYLKSFKTGTPIPLRCLAKYGGGKNDLHREIKTLIDDGVLVRLMRGFYARPRLIPSIPGAEVLPSPFELAQTWARENEYLLVPQGETEAHRLGFQRQQPVQELLWTNGPTKTISVKKACVHVRKVASYKLFWPNEPSGKILRALTTLNPRWVTYDDLFQAFKLSHNSVAQVKLSLKRLASLKELKGWRPQIQQIASQLDCQLHHIEGA